VTTADTVAKVSVVRTRRVGRRAWYADPQVVTVPRPWRWTPLLSSRALRWSPRSSAVGVLEVDQAVAVGPPPRAPRAGPCAERSRGASSGRVLLLPYSAVGALAQQIGVPAVSCGLLDAVNPALTDGDAVLPHPLARIRVLGQHRVGSCLFAREIGRGVVDDRLLSDGSVEVGITRPVCAPGTSARRVPPDQPVTASSARSREAGTGVPRGIGY
jgi:hypothetical protein